MCQDFFCVVILNNIKFYLKRDDDDNLITIK